MGQCGCKKGNPSSVVAWIVDLLLRCNRPGKQRVNGANKLTIMGTFAYVKDLAKSSVYSPEYPIRVRGRKKMTLVLDLDEKIGRASCRERV